MRKVVLSHLEFKDKNFNSSQQIRNTLVALKFSLEYIVRKTPGSWGNRAFFLKKMETKIYFKGKDTDFLFQKVLLLGSAVLRSRDFNGLYLLIFIDLGYIVVK